jgi:hypothetical protein
MDYNGTLLTYTEVAVTFTGFAALVTVIRRRGSAEVRPQLARRLRAMIENSLLVALFSIIALSIRAFGVSDETTWRICSGLLAVAWSAELVFALSQARRMEEAGIQWGSAPYRYFHYTILAASLASLVGNSLGVFSSAAGPVFLSNLGVLLFLAGVFFYRLVMVIVPEGPPPDRAA